MEVIQDYFLCDACKGKDFKLIYNFSLKFHGINFSDNLIYDRITDEIYECTNCHKTFTRQQIEQGLDEIKKKYRKTAQE